MTTGETSQKEQTSRQTKQRAQHKENTLRARRKERGTQRHTKNLGAPAATKRRSTWLKSEKIKKNQSSETLGQSDNLCTESQQEIMSRSFSDRSRMIHR